MVMPLWIGLGASPIWDANEALYAETAREMLERSDFLHPTFNYAPRLQKPPFTYWAIAASYRLFGINEFAVRVPSALAATFLLGFLVWIVHRQTAILKAATPAARSGLRLSSAAILSGLILATTPRWLIVARRLPIDALLLVALSIALLLLYLASQGGHSGPPLPDDARRGGALANRPTGRVKGVLWLGSGLAAGLAFLIKGPVAPLLILLIAGANFVIERRRPSLRALGWWCLGFAAAASPYYFLLAVRGEGSVLSRFLLHENLERYATVDFGPRRGFFYYLPIMLVDAFPWSLFLPAAGLLPDRRGRREPLDRFCWIWIAAVMLLFSLSRNKQEYYILPAYVPMAILLGRFFSALPGRAEAETRPLRFLSLVPVCAGAVVAFGLVRWRQLTVPDALFQFGLYAVGGGVIAGMGAAAWLFWKRRPVRAVHLMAVFLALLCCAIEFWALPILDLGRPTRALTEQIARSWQRGDQAGYFGMASPSMSFYLRSRILEASQPDQIAATLDEPGHLYLLIPARDFADLPLQVKERMTRLSSSARISTRGRDLLDTEEIFLVRER
jgi:4-amino-4-deoxy-L-arabinose transferase-like glycosyltransferase